MKVNVLEAHDRLLHFKKDQEANIFQGAEDCLKHNEDSLFYQDRSPYVYLFAHPRTADDGVNKVMYWQPRLQKPDAQINSYLFRAHSHSDNVEVVWLIPPPEMWSQYKTGNVTEHETVNWSIQQFLSNKKGLEQKHPEDMDEERSKHILTELICLKRQNRMMNRLYLPEIISTPDFSAESATSF